MKGLAIENLATTPPLRKKKVSNATNLAIAIPKGFQENLLVNSLTSKLKQRRDKNDRSTSNKENASRIISAKPPKQARKSSTCAGSKKDTSSSSNQQATEHVSRTGSGISSVQSEVRRATGERQHRIDSAASDKLPSLSTRHENVSSRASRRTNSADPFVGIGLCSRSVGSGRLSRFSASTSFYPPSESTGLGFDSHGADNMIKVIKRDGVFQPIDKYAPGRHISRDVDYGPRGLACDYEVFTLPLSEDTAGKQNNLPVSRGGKSDNSKKLMKVSWSFMEHDSPPNGIPEGPDSRMDMNHTPVGRPTNYTDNMAFKRPVYSSGKSGIKSIGVKWTVPAVAASEDVEAQRSLPSACSTSSKPMWSWLITPEPSNTNSANKQQRQRSPTRVKSVGQLSRASKSKESPTPSSIGRSTSMFDIRTQHCRDVHPVATAMDKQGTSVTKTKWHVPSSTSSILDAKQVAMERLQMVKRPGKKIVYDNPHDEFGAIFKFQNGEGHDDEDGIEAEYITEYKEMIMLNEMQATEDGITSSTTTRRDDSNSSPTKSMSTFH